MQSKGQSLSSLLRTISLAIAAALLMAVAMAPAWAQNSVPPTAVQAAQMPEFASRLAHPAQREAASKRPALARGSPRRGPLDNNVIYSNGPINGNTDAWTINFGYAVSDSFTVASGNGSGTVTGMSFGAWLYPGDTLTSAQISITSSPFGGTSYFNQTVNFTQSSCVTNEYGYNVCLETSSAFNGPSLNNGTYWVNLQNASVPGGDPVYWDENSGVGCNSPGCPSQADESSIGTIPSEAFSILGNTTTTITCANLPKSDGAPAGEAKVVTVPPSPTQTYQVIYNFTGGPDGWTPLSALVIDAAGNLYGTAFNGGLLGVGTVFKLTPSASGWTYTRLYSFSGPDGSQPRSALALATNGNLYGTAGGGGYGDGVLFGLSPPGHALPSPFSNWTQSLLYSFTGGNDGSNPSYSSVIDNSGNIYGTAVEGGANGRGTLYEYTNGGLQVLHAFPAFNGDGAGPGGVVSGAGGLYGFTGGGGAYGSGTVYTLAGGYRVIYNFQSGQQGDVGNPLDLAADEAGNLFGVSLNNYLVPPCYNAASATVFELTYPDWSLVPLAGWGDPSGNGSFTARVTPDASGNVYGTVIPWFNDVAGEVFKLTCCWTYTTLYQFTGGTDGAGPQAAPVIDAQGNLYGTTAYGGAYGYGVVWEITP